MHVNLFLKQQNLSSNKILCSNKHKKELRVRKMPIKPPWQTTTHSPTAKPDWQYQVLARMWSNWNSRALLKGGKNGAATVENSLMVSYKVKHTLTICSRQNFKMVPWPLLPDVTPVIRLHYMAKRRLFGWVQSNYTSPLKAEFSLAGSRRRTRKTGSVKRTQHALLVWRCKGCVRKNVGNLKDLKEPPPRPPVTGGRSGFFPSSPK